MNAEKERTQTRYGDITLYVDRGLVQAVLDAKRVKEGEVRR